MVCLRNICVNTLHKGDDDDDDNNNNNNAEDTNGTMIALTAEGIAEALNAGIPFPLGTLVPTKPLVKLFPFGVSANCVDLLDYNHVTDTFLFT